MFALWLAFELWSLENKLLFNWFIAFSLAYRRASNDFKKSLSYRLTYSDIGERFGWQVSWWQISWWQFWWFLSSARALKHKRAPPPFFEYHPNQGPRRDLDGTSTSSSSEVPIFFRKSTSSSEIVPKIVVLVPVLLFALDVLVLGRPKNIQTGPWPKFSHKPNIISRRNFWCGEKFLKNFFHRMFDREWIGHFPNFIKNISK